MFVWFYLCGLFQNKGVASVSYVLRVRVTPVEHFAELSFGTGCQTMRSPPTCCTQNSPVVKPKKYGGKIRIGVSGMAVRQPPPS